MSYKIVCVDDEQDILEYLKVFIEKCGHEVETFTSPNEAKAYIKANSKNVLLVCSDYNMPEVNGFQFREAMLDEGLEQTFIVLTGFYNKEMAVEAMRLQISEFIEKPLKEEAFEEILNGYVEKRKEVLEEERGMVTDFLEETSPMLDEIEELILELEENPEDENTLNTYFRLLHTIKGTSSCLGLEELASFAHKYEDLINNVKSKKIQANGAVINVLLQGYDYLKNIYESEKNFQPFPYNLSEIVAIFDQDFSSDSVNTKKEVSSSAAQPVKAEASQGSGSTPAAKEDKISLSVDVLSEFLEMSGELTVLKNTIFKILAKMSASYRGDPNLEQLTSTMSELHKVSSLLQNQVSEMKKVSLDAVFKPMKRVIRDSAKTCKKEVQFNTEGASLRVDTSVGKLLNNVLVHLLRNSVDHGIEAPEVREERGKNPEGEINLNCYETGESIIVQIEDDGNGIDAEKIKAKALEKELYTEAQLEKMSKNRVFQILFESGFSTAEQITSVSGRGVGMDMVKSSIEEFGGKIFIDSELGKGSKFVLDIPIPRSVLIIKSLMVYSGNMPFNIPLDDVEKVILYEEAKDEEVIHDIEGKKILCYHDRLIPLVEMRDFLGIQQRDDSDTYNIVIVRGEDYCYGVVVDEIEDIEEVVVKKLSHPLDKARIFQGVTFVGDGELGLIIDVKGVANAYYIQSHIDSEEMFETQQYKSPEQEYMKFNLLGFENYCLPLDYVYRLEVVETSEIEFSGDLPLLRYREGTLPLMLLENELELSDVTLSELAQDRTSLDIIVVEHRGHKRGIVIHELSDIESSFEPIDSSLVNSDFVVGTVFMSEKTNTVVNIESLMNQYVTQEIQTVSMSETEGQNEPQLDSAA